MSEAQSELGGIPESPNFTWEEVANTLGPEATLKDVYESAARRDPYTWHCINRRIRGVVSTFDVSKKLQSLLDEGYSLRDKHLKKSIVRHRPFLIEPLSDLSRIKAYMKARQVGVSEISVTEELWFLANHPHTKWMHTFHREKAVNDFSKTRVKAALEESSRMRALVGTIDGVETRQINDSFLFLRSTWDPSMGEGTDLDGITFDEVDRMRDGVDIAFKEGLESSMYGYIRYVSTPSIGGRGVDVPWQKSNQKYWFSRCTKCGLHQTITYPDNYIQLKEVPRDVQTYPEDSWDFLCKKPTCRGKIDRMRGEWVAKYPGRDIAGYHIPQSIFLNHTCASLMQKLRDYKFKQLWENYVLGITGSGSSILLTESDLELASIFFREGWPVPRRLREDYTNITVGIDWGGDNWVVVLGRNRHNGINYVLNAFKVEDTDRELEQARRIARMIAPYEPDSIMADAGYGKERNGYLKRVFPETFWICQYNTAAKKKQTSTETKWSVPDRKATVDRTLAFYQLAQEIKLLDIGLPATNTEWSYLLKKHLLALQPNIVEEDGVVYEEIVNKGPDHLAHALLYARIAQERIEDTGAFDFGFLDRPY